MLRHHHYRGEVQKVNVLKEQTWNCTTSYTVRSTHSPEEEFKFNLPRTADTTVVASPYKMMDESKAKTIEAIGIKNIQHQLNYSNKVLTNMMQVIDRIERPS